LDHPGEYKTVTRTEKKMKHNENLSAFFRSKFRAIAHRQIYARIGIAVAKASVMRLLGVPRLLPLPPFLPRAALARNRPGPADSFSPLFLSPMLPLFLYLLLLPNPFPPFLLPLLPDAPLCLDALPFSLS
jgi:hypothetical protein